MGTPLELIKYNGQTGKFELGTAALDTLRKVKGPVAVVAVCGRARQGKSFILNQLLLKSSGGGFQVGATHRPCTKGLWMWSAPQRVAGPDGSEHYLVLLDTEGIDAYDQTAQYSTQIFSLAVLLSSMFVFNQMGGIDESALDRLSLVTEMTKNVRVRAAAANGAKGNDEGLGEHSPAFLWLLRDFYLQLEEEGGRKITPRDYLETALRPVPGAGPAVASKNAIRSSISQLFPVRDCFTLVRPMNDETALSHMDTLPRDKLRPEFQKGVKELTSLIFARAQPKRFSSTLMTGPVLAGLATAYVAAINQGAVPTIATAWQGVAESECRRGCDAAEAAYMAGWTASGEVPAEEADLEARHQHCLAAARAAYEDVAVGDETIRRAHEGRWMAAVATRYKDLRGRRLAEAAAAVNELLYKGATELSQASRNGADLSTLKQRLDAFVKSYDKATAGPTKWHKMAAFLIETWPVLATQVLDRHAASAKAALEAVQRDAAELRNQLASERQRAEQAERLHRDATDTAKTLQKQLTDALQEVARLRTSLDQKSATTSSLQQQLSESQQESTRLRSALEQKSVAASTLQNQLGDSQQEAARLRSALEQKAGTASSLQNQLGQTQDEAARLRAALEQKAGVVTAMEQRLGEAQQEAARLRTNLDQKASKVAALEAQMADVLVISERKQATAGELADARVRAAQQELQSKTAEMMAALTAERTRADSLLADLEGLSARCSSAEARLTAQEADAGEWRTKYLKEATVRMEMQGQRDQVRDSLALLMVERDSAARERDAARAELEQIRADLLAEVGAKSAMQTRMDEMLAEAQAAHAQAVGAAPHHTYGGHNDENMHPAHHDGPGAETAGRVLVDSGNIASMTIQEIKDCLIQAGLTEEVWAMANRKPAAKKADWVALLRSRAAA